MTEDQLVADRAAAIAQAGREAFRDQRGLRTVHQVVRDKRQHDGDEDPARHSGVQQREINEPEHPGGDRAEQIHALAADAIRQIPGDGDREE